MKRIYFAIVFLGAALAFSLSLDGRAHAGGQYSVDVTTSKPDADEKLSVSLKWDADILELTGISYIEGIQNAVKSPVVGKNTVSFFTEDQKAKVRFYFSSIGVEPTEDVVFNATELASGQTMKPDLGMKKESLSINPQKTKRPDSNNLPALLAAPNPFNSETNLSVPAQVNIETVFIYDEKGTLIKEITPGGTGAAYHWDGKTTDGNTAPTGVYSAVARTDKGILVKKLVLVK